MRVTDCYISPRREAEDMVLNARLDCHVPCVTSRQSSILSKDLEVKLSPMATDQSKFVLMPENATNQTQLQQGIQLSHVGISSG